MSTRVLVLACLLALGLSPTPLSASYLERRITPADGYFVLQDFSGTRVVFQNTVYGGDVYAFDLRTGDTDNLTADAVTQYSPVISGERIAYLQLRAGEALPDVWVLDLATGERRPITDRATSKLQLNIQDDEVVWAEGGAGTWAVHHFDLTTGTDTTLPGSAGDQMEPDVFEGLVVYEDRTGSPDYDLYAYDVLSDSTGPIVEDPATRERSPEIFGNRVAYVHEPGPNTDIYVHDVSTGGTTPVVADPDAQNEPAIFRSTVAWTDYRGYGTSGLDVYARELDADPESPVISIAEDQYTPRAYGNRVAWTDARDDPSQPAFVRAVFAGSAPLKVERVAGSDRYQTALATSRAHFFRAPNVILATGQDFADALAASGLAGTLGSPLLLTPRHRLASGLVAELERLGTRTVWIVGGTSAVGEGIESALEAEGFGVQRVAGADRYETARAIAYRIYDIVGLSAGPDADGFFGKVFVARGDEFADALACAPVAYRRRMPIVLVRPSSVPPATSDVFKFLPIEDAVVVGGRTAVGSGVQSAVDGLLADNGAGPSERWAGADRYETARSVASEAVYRAWAGSGYVGVATGATFPDALGGGVATGREYGVLLLTRPDSLSSPSAAFIADAEDGVGWAEVFGGASAISDDVVGDMEALF